MLKALLIAATVVVCCPLLPAQSPVQIFASGTLVIGSRAVSCGKTVAIYDSSLKDAAETDAKGQILLNPNWFAAEPALLQLWRYSHECAHVMGQKDEQAADCWAVTNAVREGWLSATDFDRLKAMFGTEATDSVHLPGAGRIAAMQRCFVKPLSSS